MTNKFIANGEIITTDMSIGEIESQVQDALDESSSGLVKFRILESVSYTHLTLPTILRV